MDALILLGSFAVLFLLRMPVAYALGMSALIGAWWIDIPFDAVMIQVAGGVNKFSLLAIPFFVLAGAIMAEGGMSRRLVAFAAVLVGFVRGGLTLARRALVPVERIVGVAPGFGQHAHGELGIAVACFGHRPPLGIGAGVLADVVRLPSGGDISVGRRRSGEDGEAEKEGKGQGRDVTAGAGLGRDGAEGAVY